MTTTTTVLCPRCEDNYYTPYEVKRQVRDPLPPALSRADNETYICSDCGTEEAMRNWQNLPLQMPDAWPIYNEVEVP